MSKSVIAPGSESCGCCEGVDASTPLAIDNRMGLSAIAYRIGEYGHFKESMLAGLSSAQSPGLEGLRTRDADDYTLGLIDAVACAADVLTFYQERVANESYLRTATEKVSLQEMAKLIGYRLRPGVAAETLLAFALEAPKAPPPGLPPEPGAFVTGIPTSLILRPGVKVQSVPGPDEKPQTFETVEEITARPEWSAIRPWLSETRVPQRGDAETWLKGVTSNLKAGDALVFVDPAFLAQPTTNTNWDFVRIGKVELDAANDRTRIVLKGAVSAVSTESGPLQVHALGKRVGVFGHNAPMWKSMNKAFRIDYPKDAGDTEDRADWPRFTISTVGASASGGAVDLDTVLSEIVPGGLVILTRFVPATDRDFEVAFENASTISRIANSNTISTAANGNTAMVASHRSTTHTSLYKVSGTTDISRSEFAISAKVTRLILEGPNLGTGFFGSVRETSVYAQSERLVLAPYPVVDAIGGDRLPLAVAPDGLEPGRRLLVAGNVVLEGTDKKGPWQVHECTLVKAQAVDAKGCILEIAPPLAKQLIRDTVVVHANVMRATHGETASQILGAGDASKSFQRFELKRLPLTYRSASNENGADSELTVRVGDVEWAEKSTLYDAAIDERAYTLESDEQGKSWVVFGDGVRGARLPSGVNNVRASYRQGLGQDGNVGADKLTQLITRPLGLKSVSNPVTAQGGTESEPPDQARRSMPLGARTLGRAVSLLDYEDFAMAFTGVAKARAQVLKLSAGPTIVITVAGQNGVPLSPTNPVWNNLWRALKGSGDPHVTLALLSYQASTFRLGLKIKRHPAYELRPLLAAVEAALRASYSFDARSLGQPVLQSEVIAVAHSVPGVLAVDLDFLYGGTSPAAQTVTSRQTRLLASRMRVIAGVALPAELLTLADTPLDRLEEMT